MAPSLYLLDGHSQIYRAYYAPFADLTSPAGEPTRATYVFMSVLFKLLLERRPTYLAVAVDSRDASASRREFYAEYKANRAPMPEDLPPQVARITQLLELLAVPVLQVGGYEADDVIASVVRQLRGRDVDIFVVGKDKDLEQLIADRVRLYDPAKGQVIDANNLEDEKGYRPDQAIDIQILMGDAVDNVPGIPGVGVKTAAKLIRQYGSAHAVVEHAAELSPKLREGVQAFAPRMTTTRRLLTLQDGLPLEFDLEQARCSRLDAARVRPIFEELGFTRLLDSLARLDAEPAQAAPQAPAPVRPKQIDQPPEHRLIETLPALEELVQMVRAGGAAVVGLELAGEHPVDAPLAGITLRPAPGPPCYVPLRAAVGPTLRENDVLPRLAGLLADSAVVKVGHDLKPAIVALQSRELTVCGPLFDTMIASFILNPLRRADSVARLAQELFGVRLMPIEDLVGSGRERLTIDQVPSQRAGEYSAAGAEQTWRLYEDFSPQIRSGSFRALFEDLEMPLTLVLADMERHGVTVDVALLRKLSDELLARQEDLARRIEQLAGRPFNIDSPRQLAEVIFDELGLRVIRHTKTGRSTDAESLSTLTAETGHPLPSAVLEYRELGKLRSTYTDSLPAMVRPGTRRIHARFNTIGAITGRLSSSDPNLQNIPVRTAAGREIRRAFVASGSGTLLLSADYSQIELRMLAHFCQDERLLAAFRQDEDIHAAVAAEVFGVPAAQVQPEQRARAKAVNFGIIYGQSPFGLSRTTGMTQAEAREFIEVYFQRYPQIRRFIGECIARASADGYASTIAGRRRPIPELASRNRQKRQLGERLAVNTVLQGSAADLIKLAMVRIHCRTWPTAARPQLLIQVHDELVFEVQAGAEQEAAARIADDMTTALSLDVPLKVDVGWGRNWLECKA
jgi:DNA polymerase-1